MGNLRWLRYVRPDEEWTRTATMSASSEKLKFEAARANNGDPAFPWWADSGSASLTATFAAPGEVGIVALIHANTDDGATVSVSGAVTGSITGARGAGGYPRNVALLPTPTVGGTVTVAVAGNSLDWSIGALVSGKLRQIAYPLDRGASRRRKRHVIADFDEDTDHEIRIDLGSELWTAKGRIFNDDTSLLDFQSLWESTLGGVRPILIIPNNIDNEPRYVRMTAEIEWTNDGQSIHWMDVEFRECSRGILVV